MIETGVIIIKEREPEVCRLGENAVLPGVEEIPGDLGTHYFPSNTPLVIHHRTMTVGAIRPRRDDGGIRFRSQVSTTQDEFAPCRGVDCGYRRGNSSHRSDVWSLRLYTSGTLVSCLSTTGKGGNEETR